MPSSTPSRRPARRGTATVATVVVHRGARLGSIAETLGLDGAEIREALQDGDSIADIAEAQGIDLETVVDSLLAEAEERLDAAVEAGRIDETKAAEMLAEAETKITTWSTGRPRGASRRLRWSRLRTWPPR